MIAAELISLRTTCQIVADTITGTWIGEGTGGATASGTFRVEREAQ